MLGFKAFHSEAAAIAWIEAVHMLRKEQIPANNGTSAFQIFASLTA